jgi:hypothetical protein
MRNDVIELAENPKILARVLFGINFVEIGLVVVDDGKLE